MPAFEDPTDTDRLERAALAYQIATGRTLEDREAVLVWSLGVIESGPLSSDHNRRAVEAMIPWLDEVVSDDDTRARLGLEPDGPHWRSDGYAYTRLYLSRADALADEDRHVATVYASGGWVAYAGTDECDNSIAKDNDEGAEAFAAAEAALRSAGVLAEGVTVRRAGGAA